MAALRLQQDELKPLSPRSANVQLKKKPSVYGADKLGERDQAKAAEAARKQAKEKEYAPPPPEWVIQPPVTRGALAEKYSVGRLLGKGGFAMVYEGQLRVSKHEKHILALKVVRSRMSQKKMEEKFRTELQIHAKMRHPNIVEFHRAFTFQDSTYVVLELCSNGSVMEMVKRRKHLTLPEVRRIMIQLCGAIKYMHARNVLHRDLKMGNLFLDHEMNLKVGDFGLAAVLLSEDEIAGLYAYGKSRRTTLCGTPNYIAPEILEKGKEGHDHKVDLWAIGVILFAMIAGQPPFQSSSQSEIYKRARNVDYCWPADGPKSNEVPEEAKDLVSRLLKVDAEQRPDPDQIVCHPFFHMHGGSTIPAALEEKGRREMPSFIDTSRLPRGDAMTRGSAVVSAKDLGAQCGVGSWPDRGPTATVVGTDMNVSIYRECAAEEAAGMGPIIPVPKDLVYSSKHSYLNWPREGQEDLPAKVAPTVQAPTGFLGAEVKLQAALEGTMRRPPVQSHAATLRASAAKPKTLRAHTQYEPPQIAEAPAGVDGPPPVATFNKRRLLKELPVRSVASAELNEAYQKLSPDRFATAPRSKKEVEKLAGTLPRRGAVVEVAKTDKAETVKKQDLVAKAPEPGATTRARIASNVQKELEAPIEKQPRRSAKPRTASSNTKRPCGSCQSLVFGPDDVIEALPRTKPQSVMTQLRKLHEQLDNSLNGQIKRRTSVELRRVHARFHAKERESLPMVQKWTNFSRKYGVGWMLDDGTVGCLFKPDAMRRTTSVVVSDCQSFFIKRRNASYADKYKFVPPVSPPVEFIENCPEHGLEWTVVSTSKYQLKALPNGLPDGLSPELDPHEYEKGFKLTVWRNLGDKLSGKQGDTKQLEAHEPAALLDLSSPQNTAAAFVRFFQRIHTVTVFGFSDKSIQFNFPDHGKLVIAADGSWVEWCAIPVKKVYALRRGEKVVGVDLLDREVIGLPPDMLLTQEYDGRDFGELARINELSDKLAFVRDTVATWIAEGGLGRRAANHYPRWNGLTQVDTRQYWQTLGSVGEDQGMVEASERVAS